MALLIDPTIAGRRARAAMEYAGLGWRDLAKRSGLSPDTVRRIVSRTSPRGFKNSDEWNAIAQACDVPISFLERGFDAPQQAGGDDTDVVAQVRELRAVVAELAADNLRHERELRELRGRGHRPGSSRVDR
jgi:transcriptional regulator with XRE-family HTH domain